MELTLFKSKYGFGYNFIAKDKDKTDKMYISARIVKDKDPQKESIRLKVTKCYFEMYKDKNGLAKPQLVIQDFEEIEHKQKQEEQFDLTEGLDLPF